MSYVGQGWEVVSKAISYFLSFIPELQLIAFFIPSLKRRINENIRVISWVEYIAFLWQMKYTHELDKLVN